MVSFPELEGPSVFLASPGDVAYLRSIASAELDALRQQVADDHGIRLFAWEIDKAEHGFDDDLPAQIQIPLPVGEKCRAVLCLIGEKIGTPLPEDFPLGVIENLNARDETREFRLVHPWQPAAEEQGGFPLSGTTFEYLSTLAANRSARAGESRESPLIPLFLRFVGDASILDPQIPWNKASWGGRRLRNAARDRFGDDDDALASWILDNRKELRKIYNFMRFVQSLGIVVQLVESGDDARRQIRDFLIDALRLRVAETERDPFKGLEVYDVADSSVFFGRSIERNDAIDRFLELWEDEEKPTAFAIVGGSGVGKSSFLRAGIIGRLRGDRSRGSFLDCVVRPGELLPLQALQQEPEADGKLPDLALRKLFEHALERIREAGEKERKDPAELPALAAKSAELALVEAAHRPAWVVMQLSEALRRLGSGFKLVLGFDQFEEILDQRGDRVAGPFWRPVVDFIACAVESERTGILYTLQANRVGLIADDPVLSPIWALDGQKNLGFPEQTLHEIIRRPFEITGKIRIASELVEELSERIRRFKSKESGALQGSLLPLISLTLRRIYERRALPLLEELRSREKTLAATPGFAHAAQDKSTPGPAPTGQDSNVLTLTVESCEDLLNVEDAIAELAEEAMKEAREASGPDWSDTTLGDLFRRLVDVRGEQYGLPDAVVPSATAPRRLAEALRRRRLLLPADAGRVRLVHEAVLNHWGEARKWLESERPLLGQVAGLLQDAREWDERRSRSVEYLRGFGLNDIDQAARMLAQWYDVLTDPNVLGDGRSEKLLRDYALELLATHPMPSRIAAETSRKPSHLMIVASYDRADLVRAFLAREPESAHLAREDKRTAIFFPCFTGSIEILDLLLAEEAEVDVRDENGWRPVHAAASAGHVACLSRLLERGAALEPGDAPGGTTLLHLAARNGHVEMLRYLLHERRLEPFVTDAVRWTPLHLAASLDQAAAIRVLVEAGADLEAKLDDGWTPLHLAAQGHPEAVSALLDTKADLEARLYNHWTPLHLASSGNHAAIALRLLERGADPRARAVNDWPGVDRMTRILEERERSPRPGRDTTFDWEPLHVAADRNSADVVPILLERGADPNALTAGSEAALHLAARKGHLAVLPFLLAARGIDREIRNAGGETPFHVALRSEQWQFATQLARQGARVDALLEETGQRKADRWTALHQAAWDGHTRRAEFLVELGADPNAGTAEGQTPLHLAAARGAEAVVGILLEHGAEPSATAKNGITAYHLACLGGHPAVVKRLAALAPAIDLPADGMVTPLHLAVRRGSREVVELLLERQHPADGADRDGWTPLHLAAQQGSLDVVNLLLVAGAPRNAVTKNPAMTPLQAAAEVGHAEIVDALLSADADSTIETSSRGRAIELAARHGHSATVRRLLDHGDVLEDAEAALVAMDDVPAILAVPPAVRLAAGETGGLDLSEAVPRRPWGSFLSSRWTAVPRNDVERLLERINPVDGRFHLRAETAGAARYAPSWYDGVDLYRLSDPSSLPENLLLCYLMDRKGDLYRLNGTSPPLHEVNAKAPIRLSPENVLDYLRFFCFFVHGENGPFHVAEHLDDPLLPADPMIRKVLAETVRPARFEGRNEKGHYLCNATIYYADALFVADFAVHPGGMVEMLDDEPVAADLRGRIEVRLS